MNGSPSLSLRFGLRFQDLYQRAGLVKIDQHFLASLRDSDAPLADSLIAARENPASLDRKKQSELLIAVAPHLEDFIGDLFGIEAELKGMQAQHHKLAPLYTVKRKFIFKRALTGVTKEQATLIDGGALGVELEHKLGDAFTEELFADRVTHWLAAEADYAAELRLAIQYSQWATLTDAGQHKHVKGILFRTPHKLDPMHLVPVESILVNKTPAIRMAPDHWRHREGFALTDQGMPLDHALDHAHYCIKCHNQGKDSCSTGLKEKTGEFKKSIFNVPLAGCPLEEKISEMNTVKYDGYSIGALGIVVVDNPMTAATGHRICNDCMKACIFQKQDPVDIPQVETRTLKDVLSLPWGFEIYSLLTRWNPLNLDRPLPRPQSGFKVLVVGLGPSGFTLAHHLMNDGHMVAGVDGLKIEPLPHEVSGVTPHGERVPFKPIHDVREIQESLDDRVLAGFGGVAEYGITVRWDKNFLKLVRLLLERRAEFNMFGGVRFGGTITVDSAFEMGFDHIALCMGAGRPTVVPMKNGLVRGVRQASDFLMALQLTGAAKHDSLANLQLRLPVVVIGGGLTAVDTATESMAYYVVQVEKFVSRYDVLVADQSEEAVRKGWTAEEIETANEFLAHARAIRAERARASQENREPRLIDLLNSWGGVTIAYRRRMVDSPSYTLNHEEVAKALEEGIRFAENLTPDEVEVDSYGHAKALHLKRGDERVTLAARAILVAAGTQPNTVLAREDDGVELDGKYFRAVDEEGNPVKPERISKPAASRVLMSIREEDGKAMSFFGDLHPSYAGNVVKAMASAKQGYPVVSRALANKVKPTNRTAAELSAYLNDNLRAVVHAVIRLTPNIVEVVVRAPLAARAFLPGQFYRLQNYETLAAKVDGTTLGMEGLALTGASVEHDAGLLSTIVLEMGGSSDLCALLKPGEPVILMGPTGEPTETPHRETVLLVGGGLGNAVLFSIGQQFRANGSRVIYVAGYKKMVDRYKVEEIERASDLIVWCCDEAPGFTPTRTQDRSVVMNIVEAIAAYGRGDLGDPEIPLNQVDRIIAIGSDGMMAAIARTRHTVLAPYLKKEHHAIGSINSPMQCMMKEICAQCLQVHKNPETGEETIVFSCANQDQSLDHVDFANLRSRLSQNGTQEKLTKQWLARCIRDLGAAARV